jgi:hypothetical protein
VPALQSFTENPNKFFFARKGSEYAIDFAMTVISGEFIPIPSLGIGRRLSPGLKRIASWIFGPSKGIAEKATAAEARTLVKAAAEPTKDIVVHIGGELDARVGEIVVNKGRSAMSLKTVAEETGATVVRGAAEAIPLKSNIASLVRGQRLPTSIDFAKMASEVARILRTGGKVDFHVYGGAESLATELFKRGVEVMVDYSGWIVRGAKWW